MTNIVNRLFVADGFLLSLVHILGAYPLFSDVGNLVPPMRSSLMLFDSGGQVTSLPDVQKRSILRKATI